MAPETFRAARSWRQVECTYCGAPSWSICTTRDGMRRRNPHTARVELAARNPHTDLEVSHG